jgi:tripartite ATP-independent transporter DctP family solute receptor
MRNCCRVIWTLWLLLMIGIAGSNALAATPMQMRVSSAALASDIGAQTDKRFLDLVAAGSNGRIEAKFFPGGTLGQGPELISLTKAGSIEGYDQSVSFLSEGMPYVACLDLPLAFADAQGMWAALDGALGNKIKDDVEKKLGLKILTFVDYGGREFIMVPKPIVKAEDLKGLKVRVLPSPIAIKAYESWGAKPVQLTANEIFTSLQTGQIDGLDFPADATIVRKFHEVAKYVTMVDLYRQTNSLTVNKKWYDGLPQDLQKLMADSARTATAWGRMEQQKNRETAAKKLADQGVKVNVLSASERVKLRDMLKPVHDMMRKDYPKEFVDLLLGR